MENTLSEVFFSIIMPAYNAEDYISEAIESVIAQKFGRWELLIINDGSTDSTETIANNFLKKDSRIKLFTQKNTGLSGARNTGLKNAHGEWIAFLDSDDQWLPEKLARQYKTLCTESADVIFSNGYTQFEGNPKPVYYHFDVHSGRLAGENAFKKLMFQNFIPVLSVIVKRSWVEIIGLQDEDLCASEDWDYWLRLAKAGATFYGSEERLFIYRVHTKGMSANILRQAESSFSMLLKNHDRGRLSAMENKQFYDSQLAFVKLLIRHSDYQKAYKTYLFLANSFKASPNLLGFSLVVANSYNILSRTKQIIGKSIYKATSVLPFRIRRFIDKHKNLYNAHYHRWLYKKQLSRSGLFFMHSTAKINIVSNIGRFISNGFAVNEFSIINLNHENSYFFMSNDVVFYRHCTVNIWNAQLLIGSNVSFNNYCSINCIEGIEIGNNTWFGEGVRLYDHNHKFKDASVPFTNQGFTAKPIKIGNNCWIGSNTVILQGVEIGDNCVIGANNLIYQSVPDNTIVKARGMEIMENIKRDNE